MAWRLAIPLLLLAACGRSWVFDDSGQTSPPPPFCVLSVAPADLDFGTVPPAASVTLEVSLSNQGGVACQVSQIGIPADVDQDFFLPAGTRESLTLAPAESASIPVTFAPENAAPPLQRSDTLTFQTGDPAHPSATVPLHGLVETECRLTVAPPRIDFGTVALGNQADRSVTLENVGSGACEVTGLGFASGSDGEFALGAGQPGSLSLAPSQSGAIALTFAASDPAPPHHRTAVLTFQTGDSQEPQATVPLSANLDVGCELAAAPSPLDFGKVILNTTVTNQLTLSNHGTQDCHLSAIALAPGSDSEFSLAPGQAPTVTVPAAGGGSIGVAFVASNSAPPHLKTGTLSFQVDDPRDPAQSVPVEATIDTACTEASQWIYTVDENGMFSRFDPQTLTFTDIATLSCPTSASPFSMAVDQNAVAWVEYQGGDLFQVDTGTAACQATGFQPGQQGFVYFGMGFVFQPQTGLDTLYIAGDPYWGGGAASNLGTISFPSLSVGTVGPLAVGGLELSGTGDGELWGFAPAVSAGVAPTLVQIDPATAATLATYQYPALQNINASWAMKFWGGSFWIFLGSGVYQVPRANPGQISVAIPPGNGRNIVGAGVSTCAPLQ